MRYMPRGKHRGLQADEGLVNSGSPAGVQPTTCYSLIRVSSCAWSSVFSLSRID
jgi:hypothetical protein